MTTLQISSVHVFRKVSESAQMIETFSNKHRLQSFEPHWNSEAFLWIFFMIDYYQDHCYLSSTYVLITQSHSCILGV